MGFFDWLFGSNAKKEEEKRAERAREYLAAKPPVKATVSVPAPRPSQPDRTQMTTRVERVQGVKRVQSEDVQVETSFVVDPEVFLTVPNTFLDNQPVSVTETYVPTYSAPADTGPTASGSWSSSSDSGSSYSSSSSSSYDSGSSSSSSSYDSGSSSSSSCDSGGGGW